MKALSRYVILLALLLACGSLAGALASGLGVRAGFWEFHIGFNILRGSAYAAGTAAILAALGILSTKLAGGSLLETRGIIALLLGLTVIGVPWWIVRDFSKTPTVADATTNIEDPPSFVTLMPARARSAQNSLGYRRGEAAPLQARYFPDLETMETDMTPAEVVTVARQAATDMGLEIAAAEPAEGRLEAVATSFWFGFKDDVVLRARVRSEGGTLVDIRSASRVGKLDGGVNGKRVRRLMQELRKNF